MRFGRLLGIRAAEVDEAPAGLIAAARADALGEWLPLALADLVGAVRCVWGGTPDRTATLAGWGLGEPRGEPEQDEDGAWLAFAANIGARPVETESEEIAR